MIWYLYLAAVGGDLPPSVAGKRPVSAGRCVEALLLYLLVFFAGVAEWWASWGTPSRPGRLL